jgi:hypothetical protein
LTARLAVVLPAAFCCWSHAVMSNSYQANAVLERCCVAMAVAPLVGRVFQVMPVSVQVVVGTS